MDFSFAKQKEYFDLLVKDLLENGWKMNEIMDSPIFYLIEVTTKKRELSESQQESIINAL